MNSKTYLNRNIDLHVDLYNTSSQNDVPKFSEYYDCLRIFWCTPDRSGSADVK